MSAAPAHDAPTVFVVGEDISTRGSITLLARGARWRSETFETAAEFLCRERGQVPNCLILDVSLRDAGCLALQKRLAVERPETPIIFVTGQNDVPTAVQAMQGGALEFLIKPFSHGVLLNAIDAALKLSKIALDDCARLRALRDRYAALSRREQCVMGLVVQGLLNKQVGYELGISEVTVKAHRGRVMRTMGANSLPALVMMAVRLGVPVPKV
jgi:FixJ family two-component response regulator